MPRVSNHFTGLSLGPPLGDQRLDLCDLYAFPSPADPARTVLILNANPQADFLHPDAVYRLAIDGDGDLRNDVAFSFVFSEPMDGRQTVDVYRATGDDAEDPEPVGDKIFDAVEVSFGADARVHRSGAVTFFAGARSDAFFFDFDGIKDLFDTSGTRNFTSPVQPAPQNPWTGVDSNLEANVCSMVLELPTSDLGGNPDIRIWGRCSLRRDGQLLHVDRAGHPSVSSFFNTDETKEEYNASVPEHDRERWLPMFVHLLGHTGGYSDADAVTAIDEEGILPDMLTYDPSKPAKYPNGRVFTDDVIDHRLASLTRGDCPPSGLRPHTDTLAEFPYLGAPH